MAKQKAYKVGIYVRLSKEDSRTGESVSIENQKLMLSKHVKENGWELVEIYQDDGFSGTNQNRPAFQRMLADVKRGLINIILIKDLSRLGRNYLEVGNLAEVFLPEHGCELVSLSEKLDDMMVFRNWFNEQHAKSTSMKVRAGRRASAQSGKFVGTYAPYGYKKDAGNRHRLVIDENTAPVVRAVFEMRASGMGFRAVAIKLNEDGVLSPRGYYYQNTGGKNPLKTRQLWGENTVKGILENEVYIGNLVSGKSGTVSYKNQKLVKKDKGDWVRVEDTHQPIIARALWDRAQSFTHRNHHPRQRKDGGKNLFAGLLYCADCGSRLRGAIERHIRKDGSENRHISYMCGRYARSGKGACTIHRVGEKVLSQLVLADIRDHARLVEYDEPRMIDSLLSASKSGAISYRGAYQSELEAHRVQLDKLDRLIESLCEEKASGLVPGSLFSRQAQKYEREREARTQAIQALEKRIASINPITADMATLTGKINLHAEIDCLDPEMLPLFIERIVVGQAKYLAGHRVCDLAIVYTYSQGGDEL